MSLLGEDPNKHKYGITYDEYENYFVSKPRTKTQFHWIKLPPYTNMFKIEKFRYGSQFESRIKYDYKEIQKQFTTLKKELKKNGMQCVYLDDQGQWSITGTHFIDYMTEDAAKIADIDNVTTLMYDDVLLYRAALHGKLFVYYTIQKKDMVVMGQVLKAVFGRRVVVPKRKDQAIIISLARK